MLAIGLIFLLAQEADSLRTIAPGQSVRGSIDVGDPRIDTEFLAKLAYPGLVARGESWLVRCPTPGPFHLELVGIGFEPHLLLRDGEGRIVVEDEQQTWAPSSVVRFESKGKDETLRVEACSVRGGTGDYVLKLVAGSPEAPSSESRSARVLGEAQSSVKLLEERGDEERLAWAFAGLLEALLQRGELDEAAARAAAERGLEIRSRLLGPEHPLNGFFHEAQGHLASYAGDGAKARRFFELELDVLEKALGPHHPDTAFAAKNLAFACDRVGDYKTAEELYERAVPDLRALLPGRAARYVGAELGYGSLELYLGRNRDARDRFEEALATCDRILGPTHVLAAELLNELGLLAQSEARMEEARTYFERTVRAFEENFGPNHPYTATALNNLGELNASLGSFDEARRMHDRALSIRLASFGEENLDTAESLNNLAVLLARMRNEVEAEPLLRRSLAIREKLLGPKHPLVAVTAGNLGDCLRYLDSDEPEGLVRRAISIFEAKFGPEHPDTLSQRKQLGVVLEDSGKVEEALEIYRAVLAVEERVLGPDHPDTATSRSNLGRCLARTGHLEEGLAELDRAHAAVEKTLGATNIRSRTKADYRAHVLDLLGRPREAWAVAERTLDAGEALLDSFTWTLSEPERVQAISHYRFTLNLLLGLLDELKDPQLDVVAYERILRLKGGMSRGLSTRRELVRRSLSLDGARKLDRLLAVQSELSTAVSAEPTPETQARESELRALRDECAALERDLLRSAGERAVESEAFGGLPDLLRSLPEHSGFVDFFVQAPYRFEGEPKGESRIHAWVMRSGESIPTRVDLGSASAIERATSSFLSQIAGPGERGVATSSAADRSEEAIDAASRELSKLLWAPIEARLGGVETVFVSADGFLGTIPFGLLRAQDDSWLLEHRSVVYLPDMATLSALAARPRAAKDPAQGVALVVGDVDYGAESERARWRALPFTRAEADGVLALRRAASPEATAIRSLRGTGASEEELKRSMPGSRYVHIATHGFFAEPARIAKSGVASERTRLEALRPGLLSGLVCAGANLARGADQADGLLTAEEVAWLDLSACDLVTLSACQTALGRDVGGEGMMGLLRAFRQAGARTVVSSLWSVGDEATSQLMLAFYERLWRERRTPAEALRGAQLDMLARHRKERGSDGASTWGAFVLSGDWR